MTIYKNLETDRSKYLQTYLLENYSKKSKAEIIEDLKLSWNYIQKMAHFFNIKREFNEGERKLIKLLDLNDNITCYWIGFLLADGHLSRDCIFEINLSIKDESHFEKIQEHLNIELSPRYVTKLNCVRYCLADKQTISKIKKIFNWQTNKTKNIPTIPTLPKQQLFSLIIGFIDGDGSISKDGSDLHIRCDPSWKNILEKFYVVLCGEKKQFKITNSGCSIIYISKWKVIQKIKNKAEKLHLPIMQRKWDRVR